MLQFGYLAMSKPVGERHSIIKIWFLFIEEVMRTNELSDMTSGHRAAMNPAQKTT